MLKTAYLQFRTALKEHLKRLQQHDPEACPTEPDRIVLRLDAQFDVVEFQWDEYAMGNYMGCQSLSVPVDEILAEDPEAALNARVQVTEAAKVKQKEAKDTAERNEAQRTLTEILSKYPDLRNT